MSCFPAFFSEFEVQELLESIPSGYKTADDPFLKDTNNCLKKFVKVGVISVQDEDEDEEHVRNHVHCNVPGCQKDFNSAYEYEAHYNTLHRYLCHLCKKCLPTPHFLDLHILEQHDSYFSVVSKQKPMFSCFLEECKHMSANSADRKDHCIRAHKFPANFRFETSSATSKGNKGKSPQRKESSESGDDPMTKGNNKNDTTSRAPKNFSFGHQRQKVFYGKSYAKVLARKNKDESRMDVETISALESSKTVDDLMESLPD